MDRRYFMKGLLCGAAVASLPVSASAQGEETSFGLASDDLKVQTSDGGWLALWPKQHKIVRHNAEGRVLWTLGEEVPSPGSLNYPVAAVFHALTNTFYIADRGLGHVLRVNDQGKVVGAVGEGTLSAPRDLVIDLKDETVYVSDAARHQVLRFSLRGEYVGSIGLAGQGEEGLNGPMSLALTASGELHVADLGNRRVQVFDAGGGKWRRSYASETSPGSVVVDTQERSWVADNTSHQLRCYDSRGSLLSQWPLDHAQKVTLHTSTGDQLVVTGWS